MKHKISELEKKAANYDSMIKEIQSLRDDNQRLRIENESLKNRQNNAAPQFGKDRRYPGDNSNNTTTIDYNSPGALRRFEEDLGSPITNVGPNDLTTLKIEDLDEGKRGTQTPYNPVWKLQITDDANRV